MKNRDGSADRITTYFKGEKLPLIIVTVSGIFYNIGMTAGPWFEGRLAQCLYDIINGNKTFYNMLVLAIIYVLVILFVQSMRYIKRFYVRRFANNVNRNMKHVLYNNLVHKSRDQFQREGTGTVMTKAISDVDTCVEGMRKFTTEIFDTGVAMVAYVVMLLIYDWKLALISMIFPPFAYVIAEKLKKVVTKCAGEYKESAGRLNEATLDRVSGALTYRVYGQEQQRDKTYDKCLKDYAVKAVRANIWENSMQPVYQVISMVSVIPIICIGARNVMGLGWSAWDIAAFTTFLSCFAKLALKSSKAAKLFNAVQKAEVSWKRIKPLMKDTIVDKPIVKSVTGELKVENLTFAYPDGEEILKDISFEGKPGEIIGVTGTIASGKSTLGKVFLCEYPYEGSITYDGKEFRNFKDYERAGVVSYMGHNPELISDTISENISLGDSLSVRDFLKAVSLDKEVSEMPEGTDTFVGSGGVRLSGGQQARVALARTLTHGSPLMILDDPFSAVDSRTEEEIMDSIKRIAGNSIVIILSHRLHMFPRFDKILWMEKGQVVSGTHDELMNSEPGYAELFTAQGGGANDD